MRIDLAWISSHKGIQGSENADELAKLGIRNGIRMDKISYMDTLVEPKKREEIILINRIISNYYNLNVCFARIWSTRRLVLAGTPVNHVIFYCPVISPKSAKLISFIDKTFLNIPRDILSILKKPSVKICRLLLAFFKATNLRI
ncbi:hypothetical protein ALC56_06952 [Trachymyrmex septentrionalis]|uniref:RNase H type-1 domain-containing protein n=1 Tax=Trachymyrmex septentrionalis TaxID=34720 RepID=A0A151JWD8_9HYME|nr:hypothetical protein ALC56_06952 [Trachymyrmex septentrionalis]